MPSPDVARPSRQADDQGRNSRPEAPGGPLLSIIPTWNEEPLIADAVHRAHAVGDEVILMDVGSPDATAERARAAGAP